MAVVGAGSWGEREVAAGGRATTQTIGGEVVPADAAVPGQVVPRLMVMMMNRGAERCLCTGSGTPG